MTETPKTDGAAPVRAGSHKTAVRFLIAQAVFWGLWLAILGATGARDRGVRLFLLNHTPDELVVVNAENGAIEKRQAIADGLRKLVFSSDGKYAYISNAVDVTNKVTVLDAHSFLKTEVIPVDGIPQDLAIFPNNRYLAVVNGARTDFMASGFDVIDLKEKSPSSPQRRMVLYRARDRKLVNSIRVSEDGKWVYVIDSKDSKVFRYDFEKRELKDSVEIDGAPIEMHFPKKGPYFFVSTIRRESVFVVDKDSFKIVKRIKVGRCRQMASNEDGSILYIPLTETKDLAIVDVNAGRAVKFPDLPFKSEVIEMGPFYDKLYLVDTSVEGNLICVDVKSLMEENRKRVKVLWRRSLTGEFRDIDVRPLGGS
ncbi:MAG: YncE family protein [bacterium]|jgi:WD40 repeat protein